MGDHTKGSTVDNDAHELAELMMRRLERQDRIVAVLVDEIETLKAVSAARGETLSQILDMLRTMGDTCHAMAAAADRLTAGR